MDNKIQKKIIKICKKNKIYLVDSEIKIITSRIELLHQLQNKDQIGGSIDNKEFINQNLEKCLSPLFILENTNPDTMKNLLLNILRGNLTGASLICSKYTK